MAKNKPAQIHGEVERSFAEVGALIGITEHQARMSYASAMRKIRLHHGARLEQMRELALGKHTKYAILVP